MKTLKAVDSLGRGGAMANEGGAVSNAIVVSEWDADAFHRQISHSSFTHTPDCAPNAMPYAHRCLPEIAEQRLLYSQRVMRKVAET